MTTTKMTIDHSTRPCAAASLNAATSPSRLPASISIIARTTTAWTRPSPSQVSIDPIVIAISTKNPAAAP